MMKLHSKIFALKFSAFFIACYCCSLLQTHYAFSPVMAAATVGFIGSFYHFSHWVEKQGIHAIIYAGAFAGMCSPEYLSSPQYVLLVSFIGAGLYLITKSHLRGFGGKLGTIAFISTVVLAALRSVW
jgi:hypothetical protein